MFCSILFFFLYTFCIYLTTKKLNSLKNRLFHFLLLQKKVHNNVVTMSNEELHVQVLPYKYIKSIKNVFGNLDHAQNVTRYETFYFKPRVD